MQTLLCRFFYNSEYLTYQAAPESIDFGALQALLSIVNLPSEWGSVVISAVVIFTWPS